MRLSSVIAAVLALGVAACGGGSGAVSGKVLVDGAPAAGQEVLLQGGRALLTATTGADGAYRFEDVPEGGYLLSVDVASTLERHLQVAVKAPATVPDLLFSGVASLTGTVTDSQKAPVAGAQVRLLGTQVLGSTDGAGHFTFPAVPTGEHTLAVTSDAGSGQAKVTLALGEAKDVAVQVTLGPPATLTGQVGFFARTDPSVIQVSVPAAGVSAQADADGHYSLSVPPGEWDLFAQAPYYPSQKIGHVSATAGEDVSVPARNLSLYTELPDLGAPAATWYLASSEVRREARGTVVLVQVAPEGPPAFYAFDLETHALRLLSVGVEPAVSADGHFAAIPGPAGVVVMDLEGGTSFAVPTAGEVEFPRFSPDGSRLLFHSEGTPDTFYSVDLAARTWEELPDFDEVWISEDRTLVRTNDAAPITWKLVTPQGVTTAFTNVPDVFVPGAGLLRTDAQPAYGVEACAALPCPVDVLGPEASVAIAAQGATAGAGLLREASYGPWLLLRDGTMMMLIDTRDGSTGLFPGMTDGSFSPDGARFAFRNSGGNDLYVQPLPLEGILLPVVSSTVPVRGGWLSSNRYVGFDDAPTSGAAYRFTVEDGTLTKDTDYAASSGYVDELFAGWLDSDGVSHLVLGKGPVLDAPEGQTTAPNVVLPEVQFETSAGPAFTPGQRVFASWGDGKGWFFDGDAPPRSTPLIVSHAWDFRFIGNLMLASTEEGGLTLQDFDSLQRVPLEEPDTDELGFDFSFGSDNTLVVSNHLSPAGDPVGGGYAILPTFLIPF